MATWNVINLSKLENFKDFSSEYYRADNIQKSNVIRKIGTVRAGNAGFITDGEHGSPCWSETSGIKYITAEFIKENYIEQGDFKQITREQDSKNARARLQVGDVLVYSVGAYAGLAAVAEPHLFPANIPRSVAIIRLKNENLNAEYVSAFINSKYGKFQTFRLRAGNSQPVLALDKIRQIEIPIIEETFQKEIQFYYQESYKLRLLSQTLYRQAEELLAKELQLDKLQLPKNKWYTAQYSEVVDSRRLDSNHFRDAYSRLFEFLNNKFQCKSVKQFVSVNRRGLQPNYVENGDIMVINSKHLSKNHINYDQTEKTTKKEFDKQQAAQIQKDDVLIYTTGAYIGLTNAFNSNELAMASNHVNILRLSDPRIDPNYLALVFNSIIGQLQTQKHSRGSAQLELYPTDIDKFIIPILDEDMMRTIGEKVRNSLESLKQSKLLLARAKSRVEELIEQDASGH